METARGNEMFVEVNTLADFAKGKKLFQSHTTLETEGHDSQEFVSMGILEGGTQKGKTSLMFLMLGKDGRYSIAQLPLSILNALNAMANSADASFKKPSTNNPELN